MGALKPGVLLALLAMTALGVACEDGATDSRPAQFNATGTWTGNVVNAAPVGFELRSHVFFELTDSAGGVSGTGYFDVPGHRTSLHILGRNDPHGITLDLLNRETREVYRFEGELTSGTSLTGKIRNGYHAGGTLDVTKQE